MLVYADDMLLFVTKTAKRLIPNVDNLMLSWIMDIQHNCITISVGLQNIEMEKFRFTYLSCDCSFPWLKGTTSI